MQIMSYVLHILYMEHYSSQKFRVYNKIGIVEGRYTEILLWRRKLCKFNPMVVVVVVVFWGGLLI